MYVFMAGWLCVCRYIHRRYLSFVDTARGGAAGRSGKTGMIISQHRRMYVLSRVHVFTSLFYFILFYSILF